MPKMTGRKQNKLPPARRHEVSILLRLTLEQDALIREAADWRGQSVTDFLRTEAFKASRVVLSEKGRYISTDTTRSRPPGSTS